MRVAIVFSFIIFAVFASSAWAHPLGNFSVNQYSRLEIEESQIKIRYVLDLAEIPTFQEQAVIDSNKDGMMSEDELKSYADRITPEILSGLFLLVNGQQLAINVVSSEARTQVGNGNLPTLKISWTLVAKLPKLQQFNHLHFENRNYGNRVGWREIVINQIGAVKVFNSNGFGSGITDELKAYPQETLDAPLQEKSVELQFTTGSLPEDARPLRNRDGHVAQQIQRDKLAELIAVPEITPTIIVLGLLIAFGLGMMHALSPGHGKAIVGAYLVGSRGTIKHAAILGLTVTITHTSSVFALGLIVLFASNFVLPEKMMPFLQFTSGLMVFLIGSSLLKARLFNLLGIHPHHSHLHAHHHGHSHHEHFHHHEHDHSHTHAHHDSSHHHKHSHHHGHHHEHYHEHHDHSHEHGHAHHHLPPDKISLKSLIWLGISGGLMPCPSALVLMLSAISLNRVGYGLFMILFFSLGLACTLTLVGILFIYLGRGLSSLNLGESRLFKAVPVLSALVITFLGALICYKSFN